MSKREVQRTLGSIVKFYLTVACCLLSKYFNANSMLYSTLSATLI